MSKWVGNHPWGEVGCDQTRDPQTITESPTHHRFHRDALFPPPLQDLPAVAVREELSLGFHRRVKAADDLLPPEIAALNREVTL